MKEQIIESELKLFKVFANGKNSGEQQMLFVNNILFVWNGNKEDYSKTSSVVLTANRLFGISYDNLNNSFHKSFKTVADMEPEKYYVQQILHYFSTYGLESLGFNAETYIPNEILGLPENAEPIKVTVIKAVSTDELNDIIWNFICRPVALNTDTKGLAFQMIDEFFDREFILQHISEVMNREVLLSIYDEYEIAPTDGDEFMRYICYKATDNSCIVKNEQLCKAFYSSKLVVQYFNNYLSLNPQMIEVLATCYNRWKKVFLSMKMSIYATDTTRKFVNRISKLSKKKHIPAKIDLLMHITDMNKSFTEDELQKLTKNTPIFRLFRIMDALKFNLSNNLGYNSYRIRNGKVFVKNIDEPTDINELLRRLSILNNIISERLLSSKKVLLIDKNTTLTVPTSEKMFCGEYPCGSKIEIDRDSINEGLVVGIWWKNVCYQRVDLDIHMQNIGASFGWSSNYKDESADIVFSGDMTDAPEPHGAAEYFRISKKCKNISLILSLNYYSGDAESVPFKFIIAKASALKKNYVLDPSQIICSYNGNIGKCGINLGILNVTEDKLSFIFDNASNGSTQVSHCGSYNEKNMNVNIKKNDCLLTLNELFQTVNSVEEFNNNYCDDNGETTSQLVDLTSQAISKDTILGLFD